MALSHSEFFDALESTMEIQELYAHELAQKRNNFSTHESLNLLKNYEKEISENISFLWRLYLLRGEATWEKVVENELYSLSCGSYHCTGITCRWVAQRPCSLLFSANL
jgi:hypothetical protein